MAVRRKRIEALARDILRENNVIEPPVPIEKIANGKGVRVLFQPLESDIAGCLYHNEQDQEYTVIGVNSFHDKVKQRFAIAHELGHLLLHQFDPLHVDRAVQAKYKKDLSTNGVNVDEIEANLFAAELLMPRDFIAHDLERVNATDILDESFTFQLVQRYDVNTLTLFLHLMNLGYIEQ